MRFPKSKTKTSSICALVVFLMVISLVSGATLGKRITYSTIDSSSTIGGTITPSGTITAESGSTKSFQMTADPGNTINSVTVDGYQQYTANYTLTMTTPISNIDRDEKVTMINGERYILTTNWSYAPTNSPIYVYHADENWVKDSFVSKSSSTQVSSDFYIPDYQPYANTILLCGTMGTYGRSFVATYNIQTNTWAWIENTEVVYTTNIIKGANDDAYVQVVWAPFMYKTTYTTLLDKTTWSKIYYPSFDRTTYEPRLAFVDNSLYVMRSNHALYWDLYKYDTITNTWGTQPIAYSYDTSMMDNPTISQIFPYIWADNSIILYTAPVRGGYWDIVYSTNGETLTTIKRIQAIGSFIQSGEEGTEVQCWARHLGDNKIFVSNTKDDDLNGFFEIMDLNGNTITKHIGIADHQSEIKTLHDGDRIIIGGEGLARYISFPARIKILTQPLTTYVYTFENIRSDHSISVVFKTNSPTPTPTPTQTPSPTPTQTPEPTITPKPHPTPKPRK